MDALKKQVFPMKLIDVLFYYRLLNWRDKISCLRPLAYTFLGYALAAQFELGLAVRNTLAVAGILAASYALNDYFDYALNGEKNFTSNLIESGQLSDRQVYLLGWLPLVLCVAIPWQKVTPVILLLVILILTIIYSLPGIRLKDRKIWGFITPPVCAVIIFLQAYSLFGNFNAKVLMLAILLFLFHLYVEALHQLADYVSDNDKRQMGEEEVIKLLHLFSLLSFFSAVVFSFYNILFLVTVFFSVVRLLALRKFDTAEILRIRKNIFLPIWSIYEFVLYGALAMFGVFKVVLK